MLNNLVAIIKMNLSNLTRDERGVTVIEYAVIAALIIVVCSCPLSETLAYSCFRRLGETLRGRYT